MEGKRVLVTGGAGFIGSNLANHLAEANDVVVVDDGYLGTAENLDSDVEFQEKSVLDEDLPTDVDAVFHLAALSSYAMHEEDPTMGARVNIEGFVNTVEQARDDGYDTVVYASTSSIYGNRTEPSPEDMNVEVNTGYEASKLARERYAEYFANHYEISMAGMRFFSVYQGYGGAEGHKGEYANVIAQFADDIANGEAPVIYGDGTQTRDFTHVDDIVRGLELAAGGESASARHFSAPVTKLSSCGVDGYPHRIAVVNSNSSAQDRRHQPRYRTPPNSRKECGTDLQGRTADFAQVTNSFRGGREHLL